MKNYLIQLKAMSIKAKMNNTNALPGAMEKTQNGFLTPIPQVNQQLSDIFSTIQGFFSNAGTKLDQTNQSVQTITSEIDQAKPYIKWGSLVVLGTLMTLMLTQIVLNTKEIEKNK